MTQNIYDDAAFFSQYSRLRRSVEGLDGAPEWPALRAMLPDMRGARVLDLGCGFGWFCRWAAEQGAAKVLGVDVSERMLERARATTAFPGISYQQADLETATFGEGAFDLVYSSLALHYIRQLDRLLAAAARALTPSGWLVCSVEHPLYTAPAEPGWLTTPAGRTVWSLDSYLIEGPRTTNWLAEGVVKQHRTLATYYKLLVAAGFTVTHLEEWGPTDAQIAEWPVLAEERQRPTFLLMAARRAPG